MNKNIFGVRDIFDVPDCSNYKPYKVYCIKDYTGKIIYIGCTKVKLIDRAGGHRFDTRKIRFDSEIAIYHYSIGKKLKFEVMYDFNNKFFAGITERLLIHFYKNFVDKELINSRCVINESNFINPILSPKHY